jgi:hypothetical protein
MTASSSSQLVKKLYQLTDILNLLAPIGQQVGCGFLTVGLWTSDTFKELLKAVSTHLKLGS